MNGWNPFARKCITKATKVIDSSLTRSLEKGDVLLYRPLTRKLTSMLITQFTRSPYSHADIYVGDGWTIGAEQFGITLSEGMHHGFVDVFRYPNLTDLQKDIILRHAYESLSLPYEYMGLFGFPWGTPKSFAKSAANKAYICSEFTGWLYKEAGIDLIPELIESAEAPADLGHSEVLVFQESWYKGTQLSGVVPNTRHSNQPEPGCLAKLIIGVIGDPTSKRDERYRRLYEVWEAQQAASKAAVAEYVGS